jgi:hypothetical protein
MRVQSCSIEYLAAENRVFSKASTSFVLQLAAAISQLLLGLQVSSSSTAVENILFSVFTRLSRARTHARMHAASCHFNGTDVQSPRSN